jgi:hypothetical protein
LLWINLRHKLENIPKSLQCGTITFSLPKQYFLNIFWLPAIKQPITNARPKTNNSLLVLGNCPRFVHKPDMIPPKLNQIVLKEAQPPDCTLCESTKTDKPDGALEFERIYCPNPLPISIFSPE